MEEDGPEAVEYIARHEAGHAAAAATLGFKLRRIVVKGPESSAYLNTIYGIVGETESSASDVQPGTHDENTRRRSAVVAMAGRAARRLKHPGEDHEGEYLEQNDRQRAIALLGGDADLLAVSQEAEELVQARQAAVEAIVSAMVALPLPAVLSGTDALRIIESVSVAAQQGDAADEAR